jgi:hypothetical protein
MIVPARTVREFVSEFRGLSGTAKAKAICEAASASRMSLSEFYGDGAGEGMSALLAEMRERSRPVKPKDLGAIGKDHLAAKFESVGVAPETFDYRRAEFEHDGLPYLAEAAFGPTDASSPGLTAHRPSAPIPSGALVRPVKASMPSLPNSARGAMSRSSLFCTSHVRASTTSIAASRLSRFQGAADGEESATSGRSARRPGRRRDGEMGQAAES